VEKKSWPHWPKTSDKKSEKLFTILICKKMSKTWPLLVLVSLKYCAEKRPLKTPVAFFMKVTVDAGRAIQIVQHISIHQNMQIMSHKYICKFMYVRQINWWDFPELAKMYV
jgi:hypothetical protein